jgi:EpsG family
MLPYWLLFAIFASGTLANRRGGFENRPLTPMFLAAGLVMAAFIGLRSQVGGDWNAYVQMFRRMQLLDLGQALFLTDPGYTLLNWIVGRVGGSLWLVNLIGGLIFCFGLGLFAREQPNPWLTALIAIPYLVIVVAMGYTRQGIAIGLIMLALSGRNRTAPARFIFFVALAATFHKSAIIVVPLLALTRKRSQLVTIGTIVLTVVIIYYLLVAGQTDRLLRNYVGQAYSSSGAFIRVLMNLPPAMIFLLNQDKFKLSEDTRRLWRNFALSALVALALLLTTPSSTAVDRISLYLIPLQMLVFGRLPYVASSKRDTNVLYLMVIIYSAMIQYVWLTYADNREAWVPYHFYLPGYGEV